MILGDFSAVKIAKEITLYPFSESCNPATETSATPFVIDTFRKMLDVIDGHQFKIVDVSKSLDYVIEIEKNSVLRPTNNMFEAK